MAVRQCSICGFQLHNQMKEAETSRYLFRAPTSIQEGHAQELFVCSIHFDKSYLKVVDNLVWYLRKDSVPTRFLNCCYDCEKVEKLSNSSSLRRFQTKEKYAILSCIWDGAKNHKQDCDNPQNLTSRLRKLRYDVQTRSWLYECFSQTEDPSDSFIRPSWTETNQNNVPEPTIPPKPGESSIEITVDSTFSVKRKSNCVLSDKSNRSIMKKKKKYRMSKFIQIKRKRYSVARNQPMGLDSSPQVDKIDGMVFYSFDTVQALEKFCAEEGQQPNPTKAGCSRSVDSVIEKRCSSQESSTRCEFCANFSRKAFLHLKKNNRQLKIENFLLRKKIRVLRIKMSKNKQNVN